MRQSVLWLLPLAAGLVGCRNVDSPTLGESLASTAIRSIFGDNYGTVFTGETRAEYRERREEEAHGQTNYYSGVDPLR